MCAKSTELKINTLEIMMENNAREHEALNVKLSSLDEKFDKVIEKLEKALERKANKWVETGFRWAIMSAGVVFIGLLVRWVILIDLGK